MQNSGKSITRLLIVDDHPVVVSGCRSLFASDSTVKIDEATDARSGHRAYVSRKPDVTVIDINLPDVSGFELMRRIRKDDPDAKIIMFSMNDDPAFVVRAIELGAQGYVSRGRSESTGKGRPQGRRGRKFHFAATGRGGDVFRRFHQGQPGDANDRARTGNPAAIGARRQDRRSRRCAGDFLQDRRQHHVAAQAEARRQEPFGPDPDRRRDGAGLKPLNGSSICRPDRPRLEGAASSRRLAFAHRQGNL